MQGYQQSATTHVLEVWHTPGVPYMLGITRCARQPPLRSRFERECLSAETLCGSMQRYIKIQSVLNLTCTRPCVMPAHVPISPVCGASRLHDGSQRLKGAEPESLVARQSG